MFESNECLICNNNFSSDNLHCFECNKTICLICCNKLESRRSSIINDKEIFVKYNCPYCRYENNKHIKLFNYNELLEIYKNNLLCYINSYNNNINNELSINKLKYKLQKKEDDINKLSEALKQVIETNKNNIKNYDNLLNLYKNLIIINGYNK